MYKYKIKLIDSNRVAAATYENTFINRFEALYFFTMSRAGITWLTTANPRIVRIRVSRVGTHPLDILDRLDVTL